VVLLAGVALHAGGAMGAGDAKWAAAAAPFIHLGDLRFLMFLFAATLLAAFVGHRLAKFTPLRRLAPDWESWKSGKKFPMGLALGGCMALYLGLGVVYGHA
jgi:prepilin peptidase CpaA